MKNRLLLRALLSVLLLTPALALAADGKVTFLFTGDNGGEVSPCG